MKTIKILGQIIGFIVLIFVMALVTLRFQYSEADGPSILFPGGDDVWGVTRWPRAGLELHG